MWSHEAAKLIRLVKMNKKIIYVALVSVYGLVFAYHFNFNFVA